ncbi:Ig-like domain-containing protein [uncultured Methanobrevibacter sp.]|uniref:Ig-like domain-containing protein n=1 Tax=uncultured Methanobrevibacter sp. TaxID=253161 RepID=UPI002608E251|nr:Ig-like domain-containing protein [uncultured Methanobrevibacter sp.]
MLSLAAVSAQDSSANDIAISDDSDAISVSHETTQLKSGSYDKTIYVDSQGDDSGAGTDKSPYASLNKAISEVNASDNAVIYVGAGIFTGENNTDLKINLAHKNYNGSLTIIGAGNGKTILDANLECPIFDTISADSIVVLKDITFINGKKNLGSAITNDGDLTIDTCVFENNSAGAYAALYQNKANNLKVVNSVFRDNLAGSANNDIYAYISESSGYNITLINSSFYNAASSYQWGDSASVVIQATNALVQGNTFTNVTSSGKSTLYVRSPNGKIIDNIFNNCSYTGSSGAILYIAGNGIYLENNKFEDCTTPSNAPIYALMNYNAKVAFNDLTVDGTTFKLTANLTDDADNPVTSYYKVNFYLEGKKIGEATATGGVATLTVNKLMENGKYALSGDYGDENPMECEIKNATVTVDFDHNPMDVWVSPSGNDTTGNGSETNPFQTIKTAIDYAIDEDSVIITVHAKDGIYDIAGDYGLSYSDVISLSIIGENYGKAIIDGKNANGFLTSGVYTKVFLQNLMFVNGTGQYSRSFVTYYMTMKDCIVNNIGQLYAQNSPANVVLDNVIWTNAKQLAMYDGEIYNCHFENITSTGTGNLWLATHDNDAVIIENSKFINMVCSGTSGAGVAYVQGNFISKNNTYDSNKATSRSYGALYVYANQIVSINDTFINNYAKENYGAATFFSSNEKSSVQVINAKFINNTADGFGGALGIYGGELINCTFENNTAKTLGGAIYMPTHSTSVYLYNLTLDGAKFADNAAGTNGQDIYIVPSTNANNLHCNLNGITVSMNDLKTSTLQDYVSANVTHESGAVVGGGAVTFYLDGSYMGVADVVDGVAELDYLGFKTNGTFALSGEYNIASEDTVYNNATVIVALAPLKDNITVYVSNSKGDDEKGNGTLENPFKTIKTALNYGYKQSAVIVVRVLEGSYYGESNNNLTVASSLDISIVGDGQGVTIIDGKDVNWFLKILAGNGIVRLSNMTVANITKNYVDARLYNQMPAVTIENGAFAVVDGVEFIRCHGTEGGAIFSEGTLIVTDSRFFNNGDSNNGAAIKNTGTLTIDNSEFIANHAKYYSTLYNDGEMYIFDSIFQDSMRVNGFTGNAMVMGGKGNITMVNSTIFRSGKTSNELIGTGQTWANNPGFAISIGATGNIKVIDSVIDGHNKAYSAQYISNVAFGGAGSIGVFVPYGLEVVNTKLLNLRDLISNSRGTNMFDTCYIENVTYVAEGTSYDYNLTVVNSCFADGTTMLTKRATANVVLDDNWWGSNDKPVYKVSNVATSPNTWLVLALDFNNDSSIENNLNLTFKVTDGENVSDFNDTIYPCEYEVTSYDCVLNLTKGTIDNKVSGHFEDLDKGLYRITITVNDQTFNIIEKGVADILAEDIVFKIGENQFNVTVLVNNVSLSNFNINLTVNKKDYSAPVIDGVASFEIEKLGYGDYTLEYFIEDNDLCYPASNSANLTVLKFDTEFSFESNVTDQVVVTLTGEDGNKIANAFVSYSVDGVEGNGTTDENGQLAINGLRDVVDIIVSYDGDDTYYGGNAEKNVTVFNGRKDTNIAVVAVDGFLNVAGVLTDADGYPIENATVYYTIGDLISNVTTDENGSFAISADNDDIVFNFAETYDYKASYAAISLKDIAPVRQATEVIITRGDVKINNDVAVNISVSNVTGTLMVYADGSEAQTIPVTEGKANYTFEKVAAGVHTFFVAYLGDDTHEASASAISFNVDRLTSAITVSAVGANVDETATITINVTPEATGSVILTVGDVDYRIDADMDVFEVSFEDAGSYNVSAVYLGDDTYDSAISNVASLVITEKAFPEITAEIPSIAAGDNATITISVANATGNVLVVYDGNQTILPLDENGTAKYAIADAVAGKHSIFVIYSGDKDNYPNEISKNLEVAKKSADVNVTIGDIAIGIDTNVSISIPGATGKVDVIVDGNETIVPLDENGSAVVPVSGLAAGDHSVVVVYSGDDTHYSAFVVKEIKQTALDSKFANITVSGEGYISAVLMDSTGKPIADATIIYSINGVSGNTTTLDTGEFFIKAASNTNVVISYAGTDTILPTDANIRLENIAPTRTGTVVVGNNYTQPAIEYNLGERGGNFTVKLVDIMGNPLANKTVYIGYNGKMLNRTTDENGFASVQINLVAENRLTFAVAFLGDDYYDASMSVYLITITKKAVTINAPAKSYKASAKTKSYTVTLKTDANPFDGKTYFAAGKKVTLKLNGKTYTAKTNDKGQATFKLDITKKGTYTADVSYAGDNTYAAAKASAKIKIN